MTNDWDFYSLRVDDQPASIFVDLGIRSQVPIAALPHLAYIRLYMNEPREDGLSSQREFDQLIAIEDSITEALCSDSVGYVGRNTSNRCRDFYFYVNDPNGWQAAVDKALLPFDEYRFEVGTRLDAEWSTYLNFLSPSPRDRQRIANRRVCQALEKSGDRLTTSREIDHWSYFPSLDSMHAYIEEVQKLKFQVRSTTVLDDAALRYVAQVWRIDTPSYQGIDSVTLSLFNAAERLGGSYDGWECPVET
jgi:uncharacterized protein (TIGR01619 family)